MNLQRSKTFDLSQHYNQIDGPKMRDDLKTADIIFGSDKERNGGLFLVYGRKVLDEIIETGEGKELVTMRVDVRQSTQELEMLLALVHVAKDIPIDEETDYRSDGDTAQIEALEKMFRLTDGSHRIKPE
jgi:hypothetical protein